jgi:hypothetical protein
MTLRSWRGRVSSLAGSWFVGRGKARCVYSTYLVSALEGADEDAAVGGVDAQRLADELGEPEGGLFRVHGGGGEGRG